MSTPHMFFRLIIAFAFGLTALAADPAPLPIPDKLVVLTFDDASASHATLVAPLLKQYGFPATFFVCEFPPDFEDKTKYMSWEQIAALAKDGFEIASHTHTHTHVDKMKPEQFVAELEYIEQRCTALGIARPTTF